MLGRSSRIRGRGVLGRRKAVRDVPEDLNGKIYREDKNLTGSIIKDKKIHNGHKAGKYEIRNVNEYEKSLQRIPQERKSEDHLP